MCSARELVAYSRLCNPCSPRRRLIQSQQLWQWTHMCARCQVCELTKYEELQSIDHDETTLKWNVHKPDLTPLERRPNPITLKPKRLRKLNYGQPPGLLNMQNPTKSNLKSQFNPRSHICLQEVKFAGLCTPLQPCRQHTRNQILLSHTHTHNRPKKLQGRDQ